MLSALVLAAAVTCVAPSGTAPVGFWESDTTSRGGIGVAIELGADGTFLMSTTVMVEQLYRVTDGKLFMADSAAALATTTDGRPFTVTADTLTHADGRGSEIRKERVGAPPAAGASPLVGVWRYRHFAGAIAFERYAADGRLLFRLPLTSEQGCYRATGSSLSIATPQTDTSMQYSVTGQDKLVLKAREGETFSYHRAEPWYPRAQIDYQPPPGTGR
jgi:2-polyprenyl-6-methoxyphenol hydroxylase-like FAD-dependent oxidoreductase